MISVEVTTTPSFTAGQSTVLFEEPYLLFPGGNYDVTADGQRFVMVRQLDRQPITQLRVVQNWFEELKRKVPTGQPAN
jgi:hypothetical protein